MHIDLQGKIGVVTGAASGVGLATTLQLLDSGITGLIAVDIEKNCPAEFLPFASGAQQRLFYVCGDVGVESTAATFTQVAIEKFGKIDFVMNNAGINIVRPIHEHTSEEWDRIMNTNVKALFWSAKYAVPIMKRQKHGLFINTGSISGLVGIKGQGAYAASKGALHQITRQMAVEYAKDGIRVNTIALGTIDTPILQISAKQSPNPETFVQGLCDAHPIGRIAAPEEVAKFVTFLVSDHATFFTGATLSLDGGFTAI